MKVKEKETQPQRARGFMFVQQISFLKFIPEKDISLLDDFIQSNQSKLNLNLKKAINEAFENILNSSGANEWAFILHDKDVNKDGSLKAPHYHVFLYFKNAKSVKRIAKLFSDEPERVEIWKYSKNNAYSYLIHETTQARQKKKYHYSDNDVKASFDFIKKINIIRSTVKTKKLDRLSDNQVEQIIQLYADEKLDLEKLHRILGSFYLAKNKTLISNIEQDLALKKHKEFLTNYRNKRCWVIWIYGEAGVGKTSTVRKVLEQEYKNNVCILGSSKDYFQDYAGENYIVINDLRPNEINYGDLLRLFDPFEHDKKAPARYHDKYLNAKQIYITTPYSPWDFWSETYVANREIDTYEQLERRITAFEMTDKNSYNVYRTLIIFNENVKKEEKSE